MSPGEEKEVSEGEFDGGSELGVEASVDERVDQGADKGQPLNEGHHLG